MKKRNKLSWNFNGESFEVGDCIKEPYVENLHRDEYGSPIVFYRNNVFILGKKYSKGNCYLVSIFRDFSIWAKSDYIFQVLKVDKNDNIQRKSISAT